MDPDRRPPILDMTPEGEFVQPPRRSGLDRLLARTGGVAVLVALAAGGLLLVSLAILFIGLLIPLVIGRRHGGRDQPVVAPAADGRAPGPLPRGEALSPFGLDPGRTFEVGRDGAAREGVQPPPEFLSRRHRLVVGLFLVAVAIVGGLAGLAAAAYASGARGAAAGLRPADRARRAAAGAGAGAGLVAAPPRPAHPHAGHAALSGRRPRHSLS
jgi:hypothetical protein